MALPIHANYNKKYKLFCKMNGESLEDLDPRIKNKKYKLFQPHSVIYNIVNEEFENNLKCQCSEYSPNEDYFLCEKCNPRVHYNNNFDVKYLTMVKQFCVVKDLDLKYRLLDVTDFKEFIGIIYKRKLRNKMNLITEDLSDVYEEEVSTDINKRFISRRGTSKKCCYRKRLCKTGQKGSQTWC